VAILSVNGFMAMRKWIQTPDVSATAVMRRACSAAAKNGRDINRDGRIDMVCYFKPDVANFQTGDLNGVLKGKTKSGQPIKGTAALRIFSVRGKDTASSTTTAIRDDRPKRRPTIGMTGETTSTIEMTGETTTTRVKD